MSFAPLLKDNASGGKALLRRKSATPVDASVGDRVPCSVDRVLSSPGRPLDAHTRGFFEPRFRHDFSRMRVHTDVEAAESAASLGARAYAVGSDLVFGPGQYHPATPAGRHVIAHELMHTIQQANGGIGKSPVMIGRPHDAFEKEADHVARTINSPKADRAGQIGQPQKVQRPTLQRYESSEHAQFGETGEILAKEISERAFTYKVKTGETPQQIAHRVGLTEEDLRAANSSKLKKWPSVTDPHKKVEGFNAGEEITIPPILNEMTKEALKSNELAFRIGGVTLKFGEGIAMGDFYESAEQMMAAPAAELQELTRLIQREKSGKPVSTAEWEAATHGRYLKLAAKNETHFAPSNPALAPNSGKSAGDHKAAWETNHIAALVQSQAGEKDKAIATNAFASHFLTDAFAAGHLINKRDVMQKFEGNLPKTAKGDAFAPASKSFFDGVASGSFTGAVKAEFSKLKTVLCYSAFGDHPEAPCSDFTTVHVTIDKESVFSQLLQGVHMKEPEVFENAVVKGIHDKLNTRGVPVENAKGDKWLLSGDGTLNAKSLEIGKKAVGQSQLNVLDVFKQSLALDVPALFKKVWDFVPFPSAGAGESEIAAEVTSGTDPNSPGLLSAAVNLIKVNYMLIIDALIKRGVLTKK